MKQRNLLHPMVQRSALALGAALASALLTLPVRGGTTLHTIAYHQITALTSYGAAVGAHSMILSADGTKIVFSRTKNYTNYIYTVNFDGSGLTLADTFPADCYCNADVDISADGSKVIGFDGGLVRMAGADGSNPHQVIQINGWLDCRISSDGTKVFFATGGNFTTVPDSGSHEAGFYYVNADGGGLHEIAGAATFAGFFGTTAGGLGWSGTPAFGVSGDATKLAGFVHTPTPTNRYALMGVGTDGSGLHELALGAVGANLAYQVSLSWDGAKVGYYFKYAPCCSSGEEVGVVNWDGSGRRVLLSNYSANQGSSGLAVSLVTVDQDGSELLCGDRSYLFNTDGSGQLELGWSVGGAANKVLDGGFYHGVMDASGSRFAYLTTAGGSYYQVATAEINPASLGLAPAISGPSATPPYITTNGAGPVFSFHPSPTNGIVANGGAQAGILLNGFADPASWQGSTLRDNGANGDSVKGDGIYSDNSGYFYYQPPIGPRTLRFKAEVLGADGNYHATAVDMAPFFVVGQAPTNPPPTVTSLDPCNALPGAQITITGSGFDPTCGNNVVLFGNLRAQVVSVNPAGTQLVVVVPGCLPPGPVSVTVSSQGQTSGSTSFGSADSLELMMLAGVNLRGTVGLAYRIDYLSDLSNTNSWVPLATNVLPCSPYFWADVSSTNQPRRFYRAVRLQ